MDTLVCMLHNLLKRESVGSVGRTRVYPRARAASGRALVLHGGRHRIAPRVPGLRARRDHSDRPRLRLEPGKTRADSLLRA
eukprot:6182172-Pleurochrysis_carterae.AAC.1